MSSRSADCAPSIPSWQAKSHETPPGWGGTSAPRGQIALAEHGSEPSNGDRSWLRPSEAECIKAGRRLRDRDRAQWPPEEVVIHPRRSRSPVPPCR